jgi:translation initiation factor IF-1
METDFDKYLKLLDDRIKTQLEKLPYDRTYSAVVVSVGTGKANIRLQGGSNIISNVPNKTGVTLVSGDEVFVEAINNSLNNLVIKYKK